MAEVLRWSQTVIELADGEPTKGNFVFGSPLPLALATRGTARWALGRAGWRDDYDRALAMARSTDPMSHARVITFTYGAAIARGVLLADDAALRDIEEALASSERSSEDIAVGMARGTMGIALVHRDSPAERERGLVVLGQVRDMCLNGRFHSIFASCRRRVHRPGAGQARRPQCCHTQMCAAIDDLFRSGQLGYCVPATGVLVETLLERGAEGDVAEAEAAIERLAARRGRPGFGDARHLAAANARAAGPCPRRRGRLPRLSGSLPRDGEIPWLRGAHDVGRGDAMTPAAPSGVVTFLFTDVEGSTRRWEADAAAMRAALVTHDEVLRAAIEAHGGLLFKHTGDGVCAAFASPKSAVDAAVAAQRALELPVRMGIGDR